MAFEVELYPIGGEGPVVELLLVARLGPPGIQRLTITDARGLPVSGVPELQDECPTGTIELRLPPISTYRLPLVVEAVECQTGRTHESGPLLAPSPMPMPGGGGSLGCTSTFITPPTPECVSAAAEVRRTRAAAVEQCGRNEDFAHERDSQREWANRLWVAAGAAIAMGLSALASGNWIGAIIGAIVLGIAAGLIYAATVVYGLAERWDSRLVEGRQRFRELRDEFEAATAEAGRRCCPGQETYDSSDVDCEA